MSKLIFAAVIVVIVILGIIFAVLNADPVHLNFYFGSRQMPLSLALILATLAGAFLVSRMRRSVDVAEKEIANLRAIPIKNKH